MKSKRIHIPVQNSDQIRTVRETLGAISEMEKFSYRVRERKNKSGIYASVTINNNRK